MQSLSGLFESKGMMFAAGALAFIVAALLIMLIFRLVFGRRLRVPGSARSRQPRLGLVDAYDLDKERQLVIVRRDNVEHLIMIGGPNDLVIESQIVRVEGRAERPPKDSKDQLSLPIANVAKVRTPEPEFEASQIDLPLPPEAPAELVVNEPPKPAGISRPRWLGSRNTADEAPVPVAVAPVVAPKPAAPVAPPVPVAPVVAPAQPAHEVQVSFEDLEAELMGASTPAPAPVVPPAPVIAAPPAPPRPAAPQVRPYEPRVEPRPTPSVTPPPFLRPASPSTQAGDKPAGTFGRTTTPVIPPRQLSGQEGERPTMPPPRPTYTPRPLTTPTLPKVEAKPVEAKPAEPVAPVEAKVEPQQAPKLEAKPAEIIKPVEAPRPLPAPVAPKIEAPVLPAPKPEPAPIAPKPEPAPPAPKLEPAKAPSPDLDVLDSLEEEMAKLLGRPQG